MVSFFAQTPINKKNYEENFQNKIFAVASNCHPLFSTLKSKGIIKKEPFECSHKVAAKFLKFNIDDLREVAQCSQKCKFEENSNIDIIYEWLKVDLSIPEIPIDEWSFDNLKPYPKKLLQFWAEKKQLIRPNQKTKKENLINALLDWAGENSSHGLKLTMGKAVDFQLRLEDKSPWAKKYSEFYGCLDRINRYYYKLMGDGKHSSHYHFNTFLSLMVLTCYNSWIAMKQLCQRDDLKFKHFIEELIQEWVNVSFSP